MERKKRNDKRKQATRQNLLDAAARLFIRNGYHNTLISEIVAEAGVGQGTFYRYFNDKRDIFAVLLDDFIGRLLAQFTPMSVNLPTTGQEYYDSSLAALQRMAAIVNENMDLTRLLTREGPSVDHAMAAHLDALYDRFADLARYFLDHAVEAGFARPCRSQVVSQALVGMALRIINSTWQGSLKDTPLDELIAESVEFAFRGFGLFKQHPLQD